MVVRSLRSGIATSGLSLAALLFAMSYSTGVQAEDVGGYYLGFRDSAQKDSECGTQKDIDGIQKVDLGGIQKDSCDSTQKIDDVCIIQNAPECQKCCDTTCCEDCTRLTVGASALFMTRATREAIDLNVIEGPDAGVFDIDDLGFDNETSYRLNAGVRFLDWELQGIFSDYGSWSTNRAGVLTNGVSFDSGNQAGNPWAAENGIETGSIFRPIFEAASGGLAADEFDGFEPGTTVFAANTPPSYTMSYRSDVETVEANLLPRDFVAGWHGGGWRVGIGYGHTEVDELFNVSMTGIFRAVDVAGPNGGLTHFDLTDAAEGNLNLIGGLGNGFSDAEVQHPTDGNPAVADTLVFAHSTATRNQLNGFQLIYDAVLVECNRFSTDALLKAGIYDNDARGAISQRYSDEDSTYGRDFVDTENSIAYMWSVGMGGKLRIRDSISVTGGYDVTYITGLALAPNQTISGNSYSVHTDGSLLLHGARVGIEGRF